MRIGIISDVHGNLPGLTACWDVLISQGVDQVVCLGDLVQYGPYPSEVVDFVLRHDIDTVQGNCDRAAGRGRPDTGDTFDNVHWENMSAESLQWTVDQLSPSQRRFLRRLPAELRYRSGRFNLLCVHGLPGNVTGSLRGNASEEVCRLLLSRNSCDILALGHTHEMFLHSSRRGLIVNPGSTGGGTLPEESTLAVLDLNPDTGTVSVSWQRVPFDMEAYTRKYGHEGLPDTFLKCVLLGRDPRGRWLNEDINRRQRWAEL